LARETKKRCRRSAISSLARKLRCDDGIRWHGWHSVARSYGDRSKRVFTRC